MLDEPTAAIISRGTRKMPLPMMMPTTIAVAWETFRTRGSSDGVSFMGCREVSTGARSPCTIKSDVMLKAQPVFEEIFTTPANKIDIAPFVGHRERVIHASRDFDGVVKLMHLSGCGSINDNHDVACHAVWSPQPVVVMAADSCRQTMPKKVNRTGYAISGAVDAHPGLVLRR